MLYPWRILAVMAVAGSLFAAEVKTSKSPSLFNLPLWDEGKVPLAAGDGPLDAPFLTAFLPPEGKRNGTAVVVAPGGSNIMLMYGAEGMEVAERLNDWGVAAFVLTYRLSPKYKEAARIQDGNRALQLVRARAQEWNLKPDKVGFAGFSAGSELARLVAANTTPADPNSADPLDRVASRPDFLVMVYSAGHPTPNEQLKNFPPTFLLSAAADGPANPSAQLFVDLNKSGAVAELHIYQKGRHGFGAAYGSPEFSPWMTILQHFLQQGGFLPKGT
jgi:acetyl esterase/lipase